MGESHLLDDLRTRAMVAGAQVLTGQAVGEGGSPYHLGRGIARWLAILAEPEEL